MLVKGFNPSLPSLTRGIRSSDKSVAGDGTQTNGLSDSACPLATPERGARALRWGAAAAAYGALTGGATALAYNTFGFEVGTAVHMTAILAGGAAGSAVIGKQLPGMDPPMAHAIGALLGAGLTWGTSAFGLLQNPLLGVVAGATLGAFYGGIAGAIFPTE